MECPNCKEEIKYITADRQFVDSKTINERIPNFLGDFFYWCKNCGTLIIRYKASNGEMKDTGPYIPEETIGIRRE